MGQFQTLKIAAVFFKLLSVWQKSLKLAVSKIMMKMKLIWRIFFYFENRKNILAAWPLISAKITNYHANFNDDSKHLHNKMITSQWFRKFTLSCFSTLFAINCKFLLYSTNKQYFFGWFWPYQNASCHNSLFLGSTKTEIKINIPFYFTKWRFCPASTSQGSKDQKYVG